jgi:nicotinate-nucleotide adenylyltransferase
MVKSEHKKLGILGGTFDPPHLAHLRIAEEIREAFNLEKVLFIPAGYPPHKLTAPISPFEDRLNMVKLAIRENPFFEALDIEKEIKPSYTLKTLKKLKELYPESEFFLIIGWDSFCEFETWWEYDKFLNYTNIIVVPRGEVSQQEIEIYFYKKVKELWAEYCGKHKVFFYKALSLNISATVIRNLCKAGKSIRYLVPEEVYFYIKEKRLYQV